MCHKMIKVQNFIKVMKISVTSIHANYVYELFILGYFVVQR